MEIKEKGVKDITIKIIRVKNQYVKMENERFKKRKLKADNLNLKQ